MRYREHILYDIICTARDMPVRRMLTCLCIIIDQGYLYRNMRH